MSYLALVAASLIIIALLWKLSGAIDALLD